jgi:hypothetical protein
MKVNKIKIAIIDNGINKKIYSELIKTKIKTYKISNMSCVLEEEDMTHDYLNHGTVCASILTEFISDATILSISLGEFNILSIDNLEIALKWCLNNSINIICMSIGVTSRIDMKHLFPLFNTLVQNNIIIVASGSNDGLITYPAALQSVIGVKYKDINNNNSMLFINNPIDGIDIISNMPESIVLNKLKQKYNFINPRTNSIVTPYVAARLAGFMKTGYKMVNLTDLKQKFGMYLNAQMKENDFLIEKVELLQKIENINVPIIGFIYEEKDSKYMENISLSLHNILCCNGYNSILLSTCIENNIEESIFKIDETNIKSNIVKCSLITINDIILLHLPKRLLFYYKINQFIDLLIICRLFENNYLENNNVMIMSNNIENQEYDANIIFQRIIEIFN